MSMVKLNVVGISGQAGAGKDEVAQRFVQEHGFVQVALADPLKRLGYNAFDFTEQQLWGPSKHRNAVDSRYTGGPQWDKTGLNISGGYGACWVSDVTGFDPDSEEAHKAHQKLEEWYEWLYRCHTELSPRIMLQTLGTEWGRDVVGLDIWVNYMISKAKKLLSIDRVSYDRTVGLTVVPEDTTIGGVVVSDIRFKNELEIIPDQGGFLMRIVRPETDKQAQGIGIASHRSESDQLEFSDELFNAIIRNDGSLQDLYSAIDVVAGTL